MVKLVGDSVEGFGFGYGFAVAVDPAVRYGATAGEFYWNGGAGTMNWVDPQNQVVAVIMKHVRFDPGHDIATDIRKLLKDAR